MLRIAVLDDQQEYIEKIKIITKKTMFKLGYQYSIQDYICSEQLLDDLEDNKQYDIFLLDVELPGQSGIEVAQNIRKIEAYSAIIYITNYVEYAIQGYEVNAFRYISKHTLDTKLPEAYEALCQYIIDIKANFYTIKKNHQIERILFQDIFYLEKAGKYVLIVHKRGCSKVRKTLAELFKEFQDAASFIIIDRSYIVNMIHIMSLKDGKIFLRDGSILPISQNRLDRVKNEIINYWRVY